jgi:hypothetical protein
MRGNLFSKPPKYTIDSSCLMDIFGTDKIISKQYMPGLWERIVHLIDQGLVVSHVEVLKEIKKDGAKGEELFDWAHSRSEIFLEYELVQEGAIIKAMAPKYTGFVNGKLSPVHADPWLVAQAKRLGLILITEEKRSGSADPRKHKIPNVCDDPSIGVRCIDLLGLVKEEGWTF